MTFGPNSFHWMTHYLTLMWLETRCSTTTWARLATTLCKSRIRHMFLLIMWCRMACANLSMEISSIMQGHMFRMLKTRRHFIITRSSSNLTSWISSKFCIKTKWFKGSSRWQARPSNRNRPRSWRKIRKRNCTTKSLLKKTVFRNVNKPKMSLRLLKHQLTKASQSKTEKLWKSGRRYSLSSSHHAHSWQVNHQIKPAVEEAWTHQVIQIIQQLPTPRNQRFLSSNM